MEFIFGNSGEGYELLYKSSDKDIAVNDYMQKINKFDVDSGINSYAYKSISDGKNFRALFNMYAKDEAFKRGSYYNHVKWNDYGRDYFMRQAFLDDIIYPFASQQDVDRLRISNELDVSGGRKSVSPLNIKTLRACFPLDVFLHILYSNYSAPDKKFVFALNLKENPAFNNYARQLLNGMFLFLNAGLRIETSYITSCSLDSFKNSGYRLCVVPLSSLKNDAAEGITVIKQGGDSPAGNDDWSDYINWLLEAAPQTRDTFLKSYEDDIGKNETNAAEHLLEYYKKYRAEPQDEEPQPKPKPKVNNPPPDPKLSVPDDGRQTIKTIRWQDGNYYIGELKNGLIHGWGSMFWTNGDWSTGNWANGNFIEGFRWTSGSSAYNGKPLKFDGGVSYIGGTFNTQPHGKGSMVWSNGDFYTGEFVNSRFHGWGVYRHWNNGIIQAGKWINGELRSRISF